MALVAFLRGVNVGGHRTFRPTSLTRQLEHLGAINIGAAGTFVIRQPISPNDLRDELTSRLPFETEIVICSDREIARLMAGRHFGDRRVRPDVVNFVSVLARRPRRAAPALPLALPSSRAWIMKILARDRQFICGVYRRQMKALRYLGMLDELFGVPVTTRSWNTMTAIAGALTASPTPVGGATSGERRHTARPGS